MNFLKDMDPITMTLILLGIANTMNKTMTNNNTNIGDLETDLGRKYYDPSKDVSQWVVDHVIKMEGFRANAYQPNANEVKAGQFTIGYGTSYLFSDFGTKVNTGYALKKYANGLNGVFSGATLSLLKTKYYGFPASMSDTDFAVRIAKNYLTNPSNQNALYFKYFDSLGIPFFQVVADVIYEWSFGSGSFYTIAKRKAQFQPFIDALRLRDKSKIASAYALLRWHYYKYNTVKGAWSSSKWGWMPRIYSAAMHIKGVDVSNPLQSLGYISNNKPKSALNYIAAFKRDLGIDILMSD